MTVAKKSGFEDAHSVSGVQKGRWVDLSARRNSASGDLEIGVGWKVGGGHGRIFETQGCSKLLRAFRMVVMYQLILPRAWSNGHVLLTQLFLGLELLELLF